MISKDIIKTFLATFVLMAILCFSYLKIKKEKDFNPFTLKLNTGTEVITLSELKENKIILMYFGFLSCPVACPTTLSSMSAVFKELPKNKLDRISFVFVDLDPERDSIKKMKEYASYFHPKILPVSLKMNELDLFTKAFGVVFMKVPLKSAMGYTIDHSTDIIVISPKGEFLEPIPHGTPKVVILNRLNKIIDEYLK
ncbi:MAG: SCO family protein [Bacteriovorax sp.]|nr:SCO family protein [Bacteriovorax sp.]